MYVPKEYYRVLELIYDNPPFSISYGSGKELIDSKEYKSGRLQQILDELVDHGLIVISADWPDGKKEPIEDMHGNGPFEITFSGAGYVEKERTRQKEFWTPIAISSTVSIASIILSVLIALLT